MSASIFLSPIFLFLPHVDLQGLDRHCEWLAGVDGLRVLVGLPGIPAEDGNWADPHPCSAR